MKIKTKDLTGAALDWAVAKCQGHPTVIENGRLWLASDRGNRIPGEYQPSANWDQCGPIIEREGISTRKIVALGSVYEVRHFDAAKGDVIFLDERYKRQMVRRPPQPHPLEGMWMAKMPIGTGSNDRWLKEDFLSPTLLIAAMRCYIASKLGAEVEIPEQLLQGA